MIIYSRMTELKSKTKGMISKIEKNIESLNKYHIEKTIIWSENPVTNYNERQNAIFSSLPRKWVDCSCYFSVERYEDSSQFPDYIGECYNHMCEFLITALENEDFDSFAMAYKNYIKISLLYHEIIRKDLLSIKEPHLQISVCNSIANPIIELGEISGYAYIIGEMANNDCWKTLVEKEVEFILDNISNENISKSEMCEKIVMNFDVKKHMRLAIYNRDLIHSSWKQRLERKIVLSNYLIWEQKGFAKILKSESNLLKAIVGSFESGIILRCDAYEIFAVKIINKFLDEDKKFKSNSGWERDLIV